MNMKMKMNILRTSMAVLLAVFCVAGAFSALGCGKSDAKLIQSSLETELSALKKSDDTALNEYFGDLQPTFERFGLSPAQFFSAYLVGYDYKVNDVTVEGDKATANCDISAKDFSQVLTIFSTNFEAWASSQEALDIIGNGDENALYSKAGEFLLSAINDPSVGIVKTNVDVPYELKDNNWMPTDTSGLEAALLGGYSG